MDTPDQPVPKYAYNVVYSPEDGTYVSQCSEMPSLMAHGDTPEQAINHLHDAVGAAVEWMREEKEDLPKPEAPAPGQTMPPDRTLALKVRRQMDRSQDAFAVAMGLNPAPEPAAADATGEADGVLDAVADYLEIGSNAAPPAAAPPITRSAQVSAAMAKVRVEQRRSMARRTPYGYRLGHADGPYENARRKRLPSGRKSTTPDRRPLVENPREMEILDAIIAGFRKHVDLPLGKAAYQVAKALRWHEIANPRGTAPWHSGSIKSIYKTAMAHRQRGQATVPTAIASSTTGGSPTRPAPGPE